MNAITWINDILVVIGIPSTIIGLVYIGRKLQILDTMSADVSTLKHNIKVVTDYLTKFHTKFEPKELKSFSPLQLTDQGNNLITEIGFDNVFDEHEDDFLESIADESPTLKYDVEMAAIKSIYMMADKPYMSFLKIFLYKHPQRTMQNIAPTLGVYVRDRYLEDHPEITQ